MKRSVGALALVLVLLVVLAIVPSIEARSCRKTSRVPSRNATATPRPATTTATRKPSPTATVAPKPSTSAPTRPTATTTAPTNTANEANSATETPISGCPSIAPHQRTVTFWLTEASGCEMIPQGVSHVIFGFAPIDDRGLVDLELQASTDAVKKCIAALKTKCIKSLVSVGADGMPSATKDAQAFAQSAVALVQHYGFDGIDIDDETAYPNFDADVVVARLQALRAALDKIRPGMLLTTDVFFDEGVHPICEVHESWARCFPTRALQYVDWVNIMAYDVQEATAAETAQVYTNAIRDTFSAWRTTLGGSLQKATIGICTRGGCVDGGAPLPSAVDAWKVFARQAGNGGMMLYASSYDLDGDLAVTRSLLPNATSV